MDYFGELMSAQRSELTERVFRLLDEKGLTNKDLERVTGKSSSTVSNWKSRMSPLDADLIAPICELLGVTCDYLLKGEDAQGRGFAPKPDALDEELLALFHSMSDSGKQRLIGRAEEMLLSFGMSREYPQAKQYPSSGTEVIEKEAVNDSN